MSVAQIVFLTILLLVAVGSAFVYGSALLVFAKAAKLPWWGWVMLAAFILAVLFLPAANWDLVDP